jgi:CelD/BcsL family acetyltransferase involved in cellulose biosynthesis
VLSAGVDELVLAGFSSAGADEIRALWPSDVHEGYTSEDAFVDLDGIRANDGDYLATLSGNTRSKIRRSLRLYEKEYGPRSLEVAQDASRAKEWLQVLIRLHEARWHARGLPGAFADDRVRRFHDRLIDRAFGAEAELEVDMVRVAFGEHVAGMLYNLRHRGVVSFYQSGFQYEEDNKLKPGLTAHALAVEHYLAAGAREYDFLAGEPEAAQYKRSLANDARTLAWIELPAPTFRMRAIRAARLLRRRLKAARDD